MTVAAAQRDKCGMRGFLLALPEHHNAIFRQIERGAAVGCNRADHAAFAPVIAMVRAEAAARRAR